MLRKIATGFILTALSGPAAASPCDTARTGTYLSNVCWLVEDYSRHAPSFFQARIASMDRKACTVTLTGYYAGTAGGKIHFNRAVLRRLKFKVTGRLSCWELSGLGVSKGPHTDMPADFPPFVALAIQTMRSRVAGSPENRVTVCGRNTPSSFRVRRAFENLYSRYCRKQALEF